MAKKATKKTTAKKTAVRKKPTKKKKPEVNKIQLIRDQLKSTPTAGPTEIAAIIGHGITAQYVSIVKSNMKKKSGTKKKVKKTKAGSGDPLISAINFIEEVGGINQAKDALATIERIKQL